MNEEITNKILELKKKLLNLRIKNASKEIARLFTKLNAGE